jgi:hypothetical protein
MFGNKKPKPKKKKAVDAQVMPIETRIEHLEKTAAHNEESKEALLDAIDKELLKISDCAEGTTRCRRKKQ